MAVTDSRIVWLDMEMTGLDPERCVPLQVAVVITDADLLELDSVELTIWQPEASLLTMEPFVLKMHTDNGLLAKVRRSETSLASAERAMIEMLTKWCPYQGGVLAGNSIHVDRTFLKKYFQVFEGYLHYRMIDVSSIKELVRRWYASDKAFGKGTGTHTALQDIRESIAELAHYRQKVFLPR
ncbi:MAG: oligoribonuclease [Deltaproteobacteria bacterium]|nr:oligoribonuclease [Deltaproteobacteria bacterium]